MIEESRRDDQVDLRRKIRGLQWLVFWAFLFGAGIGLYAGFTLGVGVGKTAHEIEQRR